jgi:hypothetical protein
MHRAHYIEKVLRRALFIPGDVYDVYPSHAINDLLVAAREEIAGFVLPIRAITVLGFKKFPDKENNEIGHLNHRVSSGVDWIAKLNKPLEPSSIDNFITAVVCNSIDLILVSFHGIKNDHGSGRATKHFSGVTLDVAYEVIEAEQIGCRKVKKCRCRFGEICRQTWLVDPARR